MVGTVAAQTIRTPENQAAFLAALSATANVTRSCEEAGIGRQSAYQWRNDDPLFAAAWVEAQRLGTDAMEDEATRRATVGSEEPVYQGGIKVGTVRKTSDVLLMFLLKARDRDRFMDRTATQVQLDDRRTKSVAQLEQEGRDLEHKLAEVTAHRADKEPTGAD